MTFSSIAGAEPIYISHIIWMEVMCGVANAAAVKNAHPPDRAAAMVTTMVIYERFMGGMNLVHIDDQVARLAVEIRKQSLKMDPKKQLLDAIIHATAMLCVTELYTRNTSHFPAVPTLPRGVHNIDVIAPYTI